MPPPTTTTTRTSTASTGCGRSLPPASSPTDTSMTETSRTCPQETSQGSTSATSSPGSGDGRSPSLLPDGQQIEKSGLPPAPASRSRRRGSGKVPPTSDTSGPSSTASIVPDSLQSRLESRLRARMGAYGSPEYKLTWKHWVLPSGLRICALRASAPRTSGKGSSGWPTPVANDAEKRGIVDITKRSNGLAGIGKATGRMLRGWSTPTAGLHNIGESLESFEARRQRNLQKGINGNGQGTPLGVQVKMASGWATPSARDWRSGKASQETLDHNARPLNEQVVAFSPQGASTPSGTDGSGCSVPTENSGVLHPAFPFCLMGLPLSWLEHCPLPETRSRRRSRRSSSSRVRKRGAEGQPK